MFIYALRVRPLPGTDGLTMELQAAANAKNNEGALKKKLLVYECFADDAGMYKRFQPRAKGRYVT